MYPQESTQTQPGPDKQVTVPVPEDRVPEFYAFFARFLTVGRPRGRRRPDAYAGRSPRHGGHGCGGHRDAATEAAATDAAATESTPTTPHAEPGA